MICKPCGRGWHKRCTHRASCTCQHRPRTKLRTASRVVKTDQGTVDATLLREPAEHFGKPFEC